MGRNSAIEWTDHTFNPYWGCVKIAPECTNCYAAAFAGRFGTDWGPKARRRFFGEKHWNEPLKWNLKAKAEGRMALVFCASMADVLEKLEPGHPDAEQMDRERLRLWDLIRATDTLTWQLLTKRPENATEMIPADVLVRIWLGTTYGHPDSKQRLDDLLQVHMPSPKIRFLSCEPLLGPIDLSQHHIGWSECPECDAVHDPCPDFPLGSDQMCGVWNEGSECWYEGPLTIAGRHLHWVIAGGESGRGARWMHPDWARGLRDQCQAAQIPFFFKQWGDWMPQELPTGPDGALEWDWFNVGKHAAGRLLDGREWSEVPNV